MSGGPPPGYNPSDSLLSGGTSAQIVPVMGGGGGGAPEGYNAGASLLQGGEGAQIHPVMGGGATQEGGQSRDEALEILGFLSGATPSPTEIRRAYRERALRGEYRHTNKGGDVAKFQQLQSAYELLSGENAPDDLDAPAPRAAAGLAAPSNADNANWNAARDLAGEAAAAENAATGAVEANAAAAAAAAAPPPLTAKESQEGELMIKIKGVQDQIDVLTGQLATAKEEDKEGIRRQISALNDEKLKLDRELEAIKISPFAPSGPSREKPALKGEAAWLEYYYVDELDTLIQTPVYESEKVNIERGASNELKSMIQTYTANQKKLWQRVSKGGTFVSSASNAVTMKRCAKTGTLGTLESFGFHRLIRIVPSTTEVIVVIPPLQGRIALLNAAIDQLFSFGYLNKALDGTAVLRDNIELVFSAPIYALNEAEPAASAFSLSNNALILYTILKLKNLGGERVTALADFRQESLVAGCMLNYYGTGKTMRPDTEDSDDSVVNMLEPSYVIYPWERDGFDGILLSASLSAEATLPTTRGSDITMPLADYLKTNYISNFYTINPDASARTEDSIANGYLKFRCFGALGDPSMEIPNLKQPDPKTSCRNLLSVMEMKDLSPTQMRYLTYAKLGKDDAIRSPVMSIFRLLPSRRGTTGYEPSCESVGESLRTVALQRLKMFTPAKISVPPSQEMKEIQVGSRAYEIRALKPGQTDWANLVFTEEEADLLNDLNLRPTILEDIFSTNWRNMLDRFLKSLVNSNCFEDKYLLTRKECLHAREFVSAVHDYFMLNDARLTETFRDEGEALQNTDLFLRQSQTKDELSGLREAQAQVDKLSTLDPDTEKALLEPLEPGAFKDMKLWGDARADPDFKPGVGDGTKDLYRFPILLVNKRTDEYRLRALTFTPDKGTMTKEQAHRAAELAYAQLKVKYPGWKFLM
jgi:hypothetical protein